MSALECTSVELTPVSVSAQADCENQQAALLGIPTYAAMAQSCRTTLQHVPCTAQHVGVLPSGYTSGGRASSGIHDLTGYPTSVDAHLAQYQVSLRMHE